MEDDMRKRCVDLYLNHRDTIRRICEIELRDLDQNVIINDTEWEFIRNSLIMNGERKVWNNLLKIIEGYAEEKESEL